MTNFNEKYPSKKHSFHLTGTIAEGTSERSDSGKVKKQELSDGRVLEGIFEKDDNESMTTFYGKTTNSDGSFVIGKLIKQTEREEFL